MKNKLLALWEKTKNLFKQGLTPKQLALSLVISLLVSIFPVFGLSTIALTCLALMLKLNLPIMIAANYILEPIKFFVIIPFIHLGANILGSEHTLLTYDAIKTSFEDSFFETTKALSFELLCGTLGWFLTAIPLGFILYLVLKSIFTFFEKLKDSRATKV